MAAPSANSSIGKRSIESMLQGTTKRYIGPSPHDLWKPRVENRHVDTFTTPLIAPVDRPILTTRQLSSAVVDSFCETYDLDPNKRSERLKATRKAKRAAHTEWIEEQQDSVMHSTKEIANTDSGREEVIATASAAPVIVIDDSDDDEHCNNQQYAAMESADIANPDFDYHPNPVSTRAAGERLFVSDEDERHHGDNEAGTISIFSTLMGVEAESDEASSNMAMNTLLEYISGSQMGLEPTMTSPPSQTGQPSLEEFSALTPLEFVKQFSAVNLTNNIKIGSQGPEGQTASLLEMSGNSRNDATMFRLFCKHRQTKGCMYSATTRYFLEVHEGRCEKKQPKPPKPPKGPPKKEGPEMSKLHCLVEGCGKKFKTASNLLRHAKEHDWVKTACPYNCDEKVLYASRSLLDAHIQAVHKGEFHPTCCPVVGCKSAREFKTLLVIQEHFTKAHGKMSVQEVQRLIEGTQERVNNDE